MTVKLSDKQKIRLLNTEDVFKIMQLVFLREKKIDRNKEHCWVICLDINNRILLIELISLGSVKATIVEPMDVFSFALQKRAVKIILVHNHPSGELQPSIEDIKLTDELQAIGEFIRVPMIDHFIISETDYFSFWDSGLLGKIKKESTYDLTFAETKKLEISLTKKHNLELAKRMIGDKESLEKIVKYTGFAKKEIEGMM